MYERGFTMTPTKEELIKLLLGDKYMLLEVDGFLTTYNVYEKGNNENFLIGCIEEAVQEIDNHEVFVTDIEIGELLYLGNGITIPSALKEIIQKWESQK